MQNQAFTISLLLAGILLVSGCESDTSGLVTPSTDIAANTGVISQANFSILAEDLEPSIFPDPNSNTLTFTELQITVNIGDRFNRVLTDAHTVLFATEWGALKSTSCTHPQYTCCVTEDGTCSITWQTGPSNTAPSDHKNTITAFTLGEEAFADANGNYIFDDGDSSFTDNEEPYVDANKNGIHDQGEQIIDVPNGNDTAGDNGFHDIPDTFFNGGGCTHSSLCSTIMPSVYVWDDVQLNMDGPAEAAARQ